MSVTEHLSDEQVAAALMPAGDRRVHYGLVVLELGEDGETLAIAGHPPARRCLAAARRYAREEWGVDGEDFAPPTSMRRRWVTPVDDEQPWRWERRSVPGAYPVTVIDL